MRVSWLGLTVAGWLGASPAAGLQARPVLGAQQLESRGASIGHLVTYVKLVTLAMGPGRDTRVMTITSWDGRDSK